MRVVLLQQIWQREFQSLLSLEEEVIWVFGNVDGTSEEAFTTGVWVGLDWIGLGWVGLNGTIYGYLTFVTSGKMHCNA